MLVTGTMLHIQIRTIIATLVSIAVLLFPYPASARKSLSEIAAKLSIDDTLEMENQKTDPHETLIETLPPEKEEEKQKSPLLQKSRRGTSTAVPASRTPLYIYRSFGNNYADPQSNNATTPSPAEEAVTKELKDIKAAIPAAGKEETPPAETPATPPSTPPVTEKKETEQKKEAEETAPAPAETPAPVIDEKEKAMRATIEDIEKTEGKKQELPKEEKQSIPNTPARITRIGSVPSMEKEVDYVSVLEKSMLVDPQPLPVKVPFYNEKGEEVTLKQFKGKLVVLNFWATWCTPCAMEMPSLDALQEYFSDKDLPVKVIALSEDFKNAETIRQFYKQNNISLLDVYQDKGNTLFRGLGIVSLPTTMLVDQEGNEVLRMSGYIEWDKPEVRDFVRGLLRE